MIFTAEYESFIAHVAVVPLSLLHAGVILCGESIMSRLKNINSNTYDELSLRLDRRSAVLTVDDIFILFLYCPNFSKLVFNGTTPGIEPFHNVILKTITTFAAVTATLSQVETSMRKPFCMRKLFYALLAIWRKSKRTRCWWSLMRIAWYTWAVPRFRRTR